MLNVNFIGRLGADPEQRSSQAGNQYLTMRIATDTFKNGERSTLWISVRVMAETLGKRTLSKGSLVHVFGTGEPYSFTNKNGETQVGFDVFADRIEYVRVGRQDDDSHQTTTTTESTNISVTDTGKFTKVETVAAQANTSQPIDDLPF